MTNQGLHVLIIGTGAYVCGRGSQGLGTILPACFEARRKGMIRSLSFASHHGGSFAVLEEKHRELCRKTGLTLPYSRFPGDSRSDPQAYREALRNLPDPGAVIVATPDEWHHPMALAALQAGKHVLVVKPLTPKAAEAAELVEEAEERGLYNAVDYHKRWDWANLQLLRQFREGQLGEPLFFHVEYSQQRWVPEKAFAAWLKSTSVFQYLGVHYADIIHYVTGARPLRVAAAAQQARLRSLGLEAADAIEALVEWQMPGSGRKFISSFLTHWVDPGCTSAVSYQSIKLIGTHGRFESDQKNRGVEAVSEHGGVSHPNPYFCQPYPGPEPGKLQWRGYGIDSILQFFADTLDVVSGRLTSRDLAAQRPSFRQAMVATAISEAVHQSLSQDGQWTSIKIPEPHSLKA